MASTDIAKVERRPGHTSLRLERDSSNRLRLIATGQWTAAQADHLETEIDEIMRATPEVAEIDLGGIQEIDTFGFVLVDRIQRSCRGEDIQPAIVNLPPRFIGLGDVVSSALQHGQPATASRHGLIDRLAWLGRWAEEVALNFRDLTNLLGAVTVALGRLVLNPRTFRLTATVHQIDRVCWQAVPIILLITVLIGSIIAQQGFFHFKKFGADDYVVDMVAILVLREIGVLIVSIMVAGRSGSSCTAELGAMRMREEVDALRTMGLDPVQILVLPRILALVIGVPILTFLGSLSALYGASVVASFYGGMSSEIFFNRLDDAVSLDHFKVGMIKAPFMALIIGIVACNEGLQVKGSAESLGLRTTASVVKSIFLVIVLDGLFAIFFASIGL